MTTGSSSSSKSRIRGMASLASRRPRAMSCLRPDGRKRRIECRAERRVRLAGAHLSKCSNRRNLNIDVLVCDGVADQLGHVGRVCHREGLDDCSAGARVAAVQSAFEHFDCAAGIQTGKHVRDVGAPRAVEVGALREPPQRRQAPAWRAPRARWSPRRERDVTGCSSTRRARGSRVGHPTNEGSRQRRLARRPLHRSDLARSSCECDRACRLKPSRDAGSSARPQARVRLPKPAAHHDAASGAAR